GFNLVAEILKAVKNLPFLSMSLFSEANGIEPEVVNSPDTAIRSLASEFTLKNGTVSISNATLASSLFDLDCTGTIRLPQGPETPAELNLQSQVHFNPKFSSALAAKVKELSYGFDEKGRLTLPVLIKGTPPSIVVSPDAHALLSKTVTNAV